jgi:hypothetical protein
MREGFRKYQQGDEKAKKLYHAAFGENAKSEEVDHTIAALEQGTIKAKLRTHPFQNGEIAAVNWDRDKKTKANPKPPFKAGIAKFGSDFHAKGMYSITCSSCITFDSSHVIKFCRTRRKSIRCGGTRRHSHS